MLNALSGHFTTVQQDGQLGNVKDVTNCFAEAKNATLPAVSWLAPPSRTATTPRRTSRPARHG